MNEMLKALYDSFYEKLPATQLKAEIEHAGGKVAGSVSSKTSYLINNDMASTSGKNKRAHELNIPIIPEETIVRWLAEKKIAE